MARRQSTRNTRNDKPAYVFPSRKIITRTELKTETMDVREQEGLQEDGLELLYLDQHEEEGAHQEELRRRPLPQEAQVRDLEPGDRDPMVMMMRMMQMQQETANEERQWRREAEQRKWEREDAKAEILRTQQQTNWEASMTVEADRQKTMLKLQDDERKQKEMLKNLEDQRKVKERIVSNMRKMQKGDDLEDYLQGLSNDLERAEVDPKSWVSYLSSHLSTKWACQFQALPIKKDEPFDSVVQKLLEAAGCTAMAAGDQFFQTGPRDWHGSSSEEFFQSGKKLVKRVLARAQSLQECHLAWLTAWVRHNLPSDGRQYFDSQNPESEAEALRALQAWWSTKQTPHTRSEHRDRWSDTRVRPAFRSSGGWNSSECFRCGKPGHRKAECRVILQQNGGTRSNNTSTTETATIPPTSVTVTCYKCKQPGHKSPQCPLNTNKQEPKDVKMTFETEDDVNTVEGLVGERKVVFVLDTGARITVVPESVVKESDYGAGTIVVGDANGGAVKRRLARVVLKVRGYSALREVAVAPDIVVKGQVLFSVDLKVPEEVAVLMSVASQPATVLAVTRAEHARTVKAEGVEAETIRHEQPHLKAMPLRMPEEAPEVVSVSGLAESGGVVVPSPTEQNSPGTPPPLLKPVMAPEVVGEGRTDPVGAPTRVESLAQEGSMESVRTEEQGNDLVVEGVGVEACVTTGGRSTDLVLPPVEWSDDREDLVDQSGSDPTLKLWRGLADKEEKGFTWENQLILRTVRDPLGQPVQVLVLPESFRAKVLKLAHEKAGHLGHKKVARMLRKSFTWPEMTKSVFRHCESCTVCQLCSRSTLRKAPMVERPVLTEPFEALAMDLVGPLPKAKGGVRFVLTVIDLASRWPDAVPLKTVTARAVADGLIDIFSRTALPLVIQSDQGAQFTGSLVKNLCELLGVVQVRTTAYHPQTNGTVERMHGTLESMLTKAHHQGLDWVQQLPFALFALRQMPNRDTQLSPFDIVFGREVRTPLELVHGEWVGHGDRRKRDVCAWVTQVQERIELAREAVRIRGERSVVERKNHYDKSSKLRQLVVGSKVWCRLPGLDHKLRDSWSGPFEVLEKLNSVNYRVKRVDGTGIPKVVHINTMKEVVTREECVMRTTVVIEEEEEVMPVRLVNRSNQFVDTELQSLLAMFADVLDASPGLTEVCRMMIDVQNATPIQQAPYRVPDRLKPKVQEEIGRLLEGAIIRPSTSPWSSPLVPVVKPDQSIRLCVDYRRLNGVTVGDPYYMPTLEEIVERVGSCTVLSKLDLSKGYYQVGMDVSAKDKTAFVCPYGKFEFERMPFGLRNAPSVFQRLMDTVLAPCFMFGAPYLDDILVFSKDWSSHLSHLETVMGQLRKHGLTAKPTKCVWGMANVEYLGHLVGSGTLAVPEMRVTAMRNYIRPVSKKDLRAFLGSVGYFRRFIPGFANYSSLLTPAICQSAPGRVLWSEPMLEAFRKLKFILCDVSMLHVPLQDDIFNLETDASGLGLGAVLNVVREEQSLPVAYFSRQLRGPEQRYSATELEGLALYEAIRHFAHYLYGHTFMVYTDHKALVAFRSSTILNKRLYNWTLRLTDYDFTVVYKAGRDNGGADGLSRQAFVDPERMGAEDDSKLSRGGCGA